MRPLALATARLAAFDARCFEGKVSGVNGLLIEITGPEEALVLGARASIMGAQQARAEIVGFSGGKALLLPFDDVSRVRPGARG